MMKMKLARVSSEKKRDYVCETVYINDRLYSKKQKIEI